MRAVALAVLLLLVNATPVSSSSPESYLAYRIRVARGEAHYKLDAGLSRLAEKRAKEAATNWRHRPLTEVPCGWGEILGQTGLEGHLSAIRWVMSAWRRSASHWNAISGTWAHYGVGVYYREGRWFMAVVFAQCRVGP